MRHKFTAYGITGDLLNCLTDFLQNRIQQVALPNCLSSLPHGVPQRSVLLGPLLFLIYNNGIQLDSQILRCFLSRDPLILIRALKFCFGLS